MLCLGWLHGSGHPLHCAPRFRDAILFLSQQIFPPKFLETKTTIRKHPRFFRHGKIRSKSAFFLRSSVHRSKTLTVTSSRIAPSFSLVSLSLLRGPWHCSWNAVYLEKSSMTCFGWWLHHLRQPKHNAQSDRMQHNNPKIRRDYRVAKRPNSDRRQRLVQNLHREKHLGNIRRGLIPAKGRDP